MHLGPIIQFSASKKGAQTEQIHVVHGYGEDRSGSSYVYTGLMSNAGKVFDAEPTNVMEFSRLFSGQPDEDRDFERERQLLRDGRDLYECGRLRRFAEHPDNDRYIVETDVMDKANERTRRM